MTGYEIRLVLYSQTETWREIQLPDVTFKQLHGIIQKLFNFDDYHNYQFSIPEEIPGEDAVNLNRCVKTIGCYSEEENNPISEVFDEYDIILYEYDFGDCWEIIITKLEEIDYKNKTAVITDYSGRYSPMDDMGGVYVFDEIMKEISDGNFDILEEYGMTQGDLSKMEFEKRYRKGSRIRIN